MPKKGQQAAAKLNWQETHFVGLRLSQADKDAFDAWWLDRVADVEELVNVELTRSHKFSVTLDKANQCVIVSMTCVDDEDSNYNCCISSRADTWLEALGLTLYKSNVLLADTVWKNISNKNNWG